jgi:hypothetical protein
MGKRRTDSNRRDLATWLMMLLPGFMFVGLLAPAAVTVKPKPHEDEIVGPTSFRNFTPRRPIALALQTGEGVALRRAPLAQSEPMFEGARYVADAKPAPVADVAAGGTDGIVLAQDNVENYVAETLWDTPIEGQPNYALSVDLTPVWDPDLFDVIPEIIDRTAATQWDDFHGTSGRFSVIPGAGPVIPEPGTGALLALGLAALTLRRPRTR